MDELVIPKGHFCILYQQVEPLKLVRQQATAMSNMYTADWDVFAVKIEDSTQIEPLVLFVVNC